MYRQENHTRIGLLFTIKKGDFGAISLKADLDGKIFAYHYRAQLAYVMTSRQIVYVRHMWILGLQPRDKAAMLGVKTKEYFLEEFTWK